jgi:hypothetical protein
MEVLQLTLYVIQTAVKVLTCILMLELLNPAVLFPITCLLRTEFFAKRCGI